MDTKIVLKSSTKTSLSDRFAKTQVKASQRQQQHTPIRDRRNVGSLSSNPLSVNLKRGVIGSRKAVTDSANRPRIGGSLRGGLGSVASRLQKRPLRSNVQSFVTDSIRPVRGAPSGRRGFQRGSRGGATRGGTTQMNRMRIGNTATRGFGKRGKSNVTAPKKEDLDKDLDSYMSKTKGFLDDQLEDYHSQK